MKATYRHSWLWFLVAILMMPTAYGQGETVLGAYFLNGNTNVFNSRIYLWNPSETPGDVTVRVFTLPLTSGLTQELTTTPLPLGTLGPKSAFNIKLAEDILTPIGVTVPYTNDGGNLTLEITIGVAGVQGVAQVFSGDFAFGTYPLQVISATGTNTATGAGALQNNTTGSDNTAMGTNALFFNTTGIENTAMGTNALSDNTTGSQNTATGIQALENNTTGIENTATGAGALLANTTGHFNTASGRDALRSNTTGNSNVAIGRTALGDTTTGTNNTANGDGALASNTTGFWNTATGTLTLLSNTTGSQNTAMGMFANVSTGNLTNATAIGFAAQVNASNKVRIGNRSVTRIEGQVSFTSVSDRNQKENFKPVDGEEVLEKIREIPVQSWNYIGHDPKEFRHYGPVAQDFFAAFGHDDIGTVGSPTTINSGDMQGILMIAVQALEKRLACLEQVLIAPQSLAALKTAQ